MIIEIAPYGSWKSPITAEMVVEKAVGFKDLQIDAKGNLYWAENRPQEKGRCTIVSKDFEGKVKEILPSSYNARTTVHEYGGKSYWIHRDRIYFSHFSDQQIYYMEKGKVVRLTNCPNCRFVELVFDERRNRIYAVQELHEKDRVKNSIVSIDPENGRISSLIEGNDFYSSLALSKDCDRLAYLYWNLPYMPWDSTYLVIADLDATKGIKKSLVIAGSDHESIDQPKWGPDGNLYFVSDRTGWWNLYRHKDDQTECLYPKEAEFGLPHWVFGGSSYAFVGTDEFVIACSYIEQGLGHLGILSVEDKGFEEVSVPFEYFQSLVSFGDDLYFIGGSSSDFWSIVRYDVRLRHFDSIRKSRKVSIDKEYLSWPILLEFPTSENEKAYGFFYPPNNPHFHGLDGEKPPLIVKSHGGPSGQTSAVLDMEVQYWTSRGFAVVDVNYRGSTGFGRNYRERLNGKWGIVDVADCASAAKYLVEKGQVDANRLIIKGRSAGGYTTLCALTSLDLFRTGCCYYGISDLEALAKETHKFESQYTYQLIGPYPERKDLFEKLSPIKHVDRLSCPIIFFQGKDDKIVLPDQSQAMVEALRRRKIPVAYLLFDGEQHGFRKSETLIRCLEAELYFYCKIFHIPTLESLSPVLIENFSE